MLNTRMRLRRTEAQTNQMEALCARQPPAPFHPATQARIHQVSESVQAAERVSALANPLRDTVAAHLRRDIAKCSPRSGGLRLQPAADRTIPDSLRATPLQSLLST